MFLQVVDVLSNLGGQVGLWLGLSVITMFEIVELIWDIIFLIFIKIYGVPETKPFPGDKKDSVKMGNTLFVKRVPPPTDNSVAPAPQTALVP